MRLLGIPRGSSPMRPDSCAPTGLKYRSRPMLTFGFAREKSSSMFSVNSLLFPYGVVGARLQPSSTGMVSGAPYTVHEELKTSTRPLHGLQQVLRPGHIGLVVS